MDDLVAFVSARLDEDEAAAREAYYEGQRWITEEEGVYRWPEDELVHSADRKADARHIARHDPARVLREVAAKRAILTEYARVAENEGRDEPEYACGWADGLGMAVRTLASAYRDHPDCRPQWKP